MHLTCPAPAGSPATVRFAPPGAPSFGGFGYAGSCRSALDVGGDFYDVMPLSDSSMLLVVADVMGKGVPASLFAGSLRTLIRALAVPNLCPAACLQELNELMFDELSDAGVFITVQMVVADLHQKHLLVGNAGHCPLLIAAPSHRAEAISPEGIPLGIDRQATFCSQSVSLEPFSSVLLYTDGVTEARDPLDDLFGQLRLEAWLRQAVKSNPTAAKLKSSLLREIVSFQGSDLAADDQTFLILSDETPRSAPLVIPDHLRWFLPWTQTRSSAARLVQVP